MAVKICNKCGESNVENARTCTICGSSLKSSELTGTKNSEKSYSGLVPAPTQQHYEGRICSYCSEKIQYGEPACKYCGNPVTRSQVVKIPGYVQTDTKPDGCVMVLLFVATIFVPLVGLIVGGIFAFSDNSGKKDAGIGLLVFGLVVIILEMLLGFVLII